MQLKHLFANHHKPEQKDEIKTNLLEFSFYNDASK